MEPLGGAKPHRASCRPSARQRKRRLQSCSDTESCASAGPPFVHKRCRRVARGDAAVASLPVGCQLSLYVRWHSAAGAVKVNRLPLDPIGGVEDLRGLFRQLIQGAFPPGSLPDYLASPAYYKFSPAEELISLPGDIARSEFRLVATLGDGWEYTVCERQLPGVPDPERRLLVTLAEFESDAVVVGDRRYVARLLSYPTVCVRRDFLDATLAQLVAEDECSAADGDSEVSQAPPSPLEMHDVEATEEAVAAAAALGGMMQLSGSALQESGAEAGQPEVQCSSELEAAAELEQLGRLGSLCQPAEGAASRAAGDTAASPCVSAA